MTRPCYPWYCPNCGSAINDRTNHVCKSKLPQTMVTIVVARAHDGKKESSTSGRPENFERAKASYLGFKASVRQYPHHRRRFAYAIRIYAKPQGEE